MRRSSSDLDEGRDREFGERVQPGEELTIRACDPLPFPAWQTSPLYRLRTQHGLAVTRVCGYLKIKARQYRELERGKSRHVWAVFHLAKLYDMDPRRLIVAHELWRTLCVKRRHKRECGSPSEVEAVAHVQWRMHCPLRLLRRTLGVSQRQVEAATGVNYNAILKTEGEIRGRYTRQVTGSQIERLARFYKVSPTRMLFGWRRWKRRQPKGVDQATDSILEEHDRINRALTDDRVDLFGVWIYPGDKP